MNLSLPQKWLNIEPLFPYVSREYLDYGKIMKASCVLGAVVHLCFVLVFSIFDVREMVMVNVFFSLPAYAVGYYFSHRKRFDFVAYWILCEVIAHAGFATYYLGLDAGFHFYLLLPGVMSFLYYRHPIYERVLISFCFFIVYAFGYVHMGDHVPAWSLVDSWVVKAIYLFNISFLAGSCCMIVYVFVQEYLRMETTIINSNKALKAQQDRISKSINYAHRIQQAVMPSLDIVKREVTDCFLLGQACNVVSGDWYWAKEQDGKLLVMIGDCTGHGVPGAFMSMLAIKLLERVVDDLGFVSPDRILNELRKAMKQALREGKQLDVGHDGMDGALILLNTKTAQVQFAGAYNPLWIVNKEGELMEVKADRQPIGHFVQEKPFSAKTIQLNEGDRLYLFTDGYCDQIRESDQQKMKIHRFRAKLLNIAQEPFDVQERILAQYFKDWQEGEDQLDDYLILGIEVPVGVQKHIFEQQEQFSVQ
ncbi:PP2C family protein-serine/threonine phosphatase [Persicobacter psychrovividus]|uniref:PPM-type phosphatase domain-containing protein n=1 Tax=Persicobacter psychrovividus TaxID=387638 RepID=A0ABM7VHC7_9BACT|nr:hypothetical protein PEPS_26520 [Persicobacter psychrovividus]